MLLDKIKQRCGIAAGISIYDDEIMGYIEDGILDMITSGVPAWLARSDDDRVVTTLSFYVKANLGNDRTDTRIYMDLYQKKVFRLTLED